VKTVEVNYGNRELWALLNQSSNALGRVADNELSQVGISMIQAAVLSFVKNAKEPVIPAHISRWLFREPHTVSQLLMRMEKQGLVKRSKDLGRKNQVRITLTEKGEKAYQKQIEIGVLDNILPILTPEESDNLGSYLKSLRDVAILELDRRSRLFPYP